jgi:CTP:molybdopterin cytidylyltransferase MocA
MEQDFPVAIVCNTDFAAGQMSSGKPGLENLASTFDAVLICLADQPCNSELAVKLQRIYAFIFVHNPEMKFRELNYG